MGLEEIKARIRSLPEVAAWPEMLDLIERVNPRDSLAVWDYPAIACQAVGGEAAAALPGGAAVFCSLVSIHLVDDMLDEDPKGDYHRLGAGRAGNLALAFQAAGHLLLDDPAIPEADRAALQASLVRMALATAYGQGLDAGGVADEAEYWRVVEAKTPPLFGAALHLGALLGGASAEIARGLDRIGQALGRLVQVTDDLSDALRTPAGVDWRRPFNNLPMLYALTAEHAERACFRDLARRIAEPADLASAQEVLLHSGAFSYCAFKMVEFSQEARSLLAGLALADSGPIERLVDSHLAPLERLLASLRADKPVALSPGS